MSEHEHKHEVKIFIDQEAYHSANPTTGSALYVVGRVEPGMELFREVIGDREDPEVPNGPEAIHLKEDEHFHSGQPKVYHIIVNGQQKTVTTKKVTYDQIVALAFPSPITGPNIIYTVGYEDGPHQNPLGSLMPCGTVKVKDGMIFDVTPTDKS
jgi:Multiubiquitin